MSCRIILPQMTTSRWFGVVILLGAVVRLLNFDLPLEYDEIWTWEYFASRDVTTIFTDLALPNNHPLNSLAVKILGVWGIPAAIRLHSLVAGIAVIPLLVVLGWKLWGSRAAGWWSGFFIALCAPAAVYSQQARGYELQLFFLALYAVGLAYCGQQRAGKLPYWPELALAVGGVGAILTLSTSVIYLTLMTMVAAVLYRHWPHKATWAVLIAGAFFALWWYGHNFEQFAQGTQWGEKITSVSGFGKFCLNNWRELGWIAPAGWLAWGGLLLPSANRRKAWLTLGIIVVPLFLSALITHGGPVRTHLPLTLLLALLAGWGAAVLQDYAQSQRGKYFMISLAVLCGGLSFLMLEPKWRALDWRPAVRAMAQEKNEVLVVYPATCGLLLGWNFPEVIPDNSQRLVANSSTELVMLERIGSINGTDAKYNEKGMALNFSGTRERYGRVKAERFNLRPVAGPIKNGTVLIVAAADTAPGVAVWENLLDAVGERLTLNIFFRQADQPGGLWAVKVTRPERLNLAAFPADARIYELLGRQ